MVMKRTETYEDASTRCRDEAEERYCQAEQRYDFEQLLQEAEDCYKQLDGVPF